MSLLYFNQNKREFLKIYSYRNFNFLSNTKRSEIGRLLTRIEEDENKCLNRVIFSQQIRKLQYNNFGHKPTPTSTTSSLWYMVVGGGMFLSLFWDVPIMYVCL